MFYFLVIFCLCNVVTAAVIPEDKDATILNYEYKNNGTGNYEFSYNTSNGISRSEYGRLENAGQDNEHIVVQGIYSYVDQDGNSQTYLYSADENGYRVEYQDSLGMRVLQAGVPFQGVASHVASLLG